MDAGALDRHSILDTGNLLMVQERERLMVRLLRDQGWNNLEDLRVFEAGCSTGYNLRQFVQWGGRPEHMAGIDLDPSAVEYCQSRAPEIRIHSGSADHIPEDDKSFDMALAFTLFSSVHDEEIAQGIAAELFRITRPGGMILVYDMRRANPKNKAVHPVAIDDVRRWFPKCPLRTRAITLAPPAARMVGRWVPGLYSPFAAMPWLRSHHLVALRRPAQSAFA